MSDYINSVCIVNKEIESILEDVVNQQGLENYKIETADGAVKGDGYIGIITRIKVVGKDKTNGNKVLHLIVKTASKNETLRSEVPLAAAFSREIYMYSTVFPAFKLFEIEKGLQPSSFTPRFFKGRMADKNEVLVLENLTEKGYQLFERRLPMDDSHISLVMEEYGRFHAVSFALRDQHKEKFNNMIERIDDLTVRVVKENFLDTVVHRCTKLAEALDENTDARSIKLFRAAVDDIESYLDELSKSALDYSAVLHGDCWTNNMMFNYDDNNNATKPTKVCLIDFQFSSVGSPVLDMVNFFYGCSSKDIIDKQAYYMKLYYNSLSTYLRKLGSDPVKIFPYSVLKTHWKKYAKFGLFMAAINIHATLTETDEAVDFRDIVESGESVSNAFNYEIAKVDIYNDRMRHIILHFVKNNFM